MAGCVTQRNRDEEECRSRKIYRIKIGQRYGKSVSEDGGKNEYMFIKLSQMKAGMATERV